jgi:hypothetical protein
MECIFELISKAQQAAQQFAVPKALSLGFEAFSFPADHPLLCVDLARVLRSCIPFHAIHSQNNELRRLFLAHAR